MAKPNWLSRPGDRGKLLVFAVAGAWLGTYGGLIACRPSLGGVNSDPGVIVTILGAMGGACLGGMVGAGWIQGRAGPTGFGVLIGILWGVIPAALLSSEIRGQGRHAAGAIGIILFIGATGLGMFGGLFGILGPPRLQRPRPRARSSETKTPPPKPVLWDREIDGLPRRDGARGRT